MAAFMTVVAFLSAAGAAATSIACVIRTLLKGSLPHALPVAMTGFALLAAVSTAWLGYWWWLAGESLLVVLGTTILVLIVQLRKVRDQIEKAREMRRD